MKVFLDTNVLVSAFATRGLCADLFRHLLLEHEIVTGVDDRDDEWIVASAVAGQSDVLVTGDAGLLKLGKKSPLEVLNPRGMWERLRVSSNR